MPTLTFKVSPEEARAIRKRARAARSTLSAFLRAKALGTKPRRHKIVVRKHPVSGLPYDAGGKDLPPVSLEEIKAALPDFP